MARAIRQIDHVNVISDDPARTATLLTETLGLPVSAPLLRCPTFELEILCAGNVTLESIRWSGGPRPAAGVALTGIVFEPDGPAAQSAAELRARRVPHLAPLAFGGLHTRFESYEPYRRSDVEPNWTVFPVDGVLSEQLTIVSRSSARAMVDGTPTAGATASLMSRVASSRALGKASAGLFALPPEFLAICVWGHDLAARRAADAQAFAAAQAAGPGITGMSEVVVSARDVDAARRRWQQLLDPAPCSGDRWVLGDGPALSLTSGDRDGMARLVFRAASLPVARAWLDERALLGADSTVDELRLVPDRVGGLDLRVAE
jgi:catechol 2,3-dioxygenase-like lactoylglutathione lyase family enzyme